MGRHGPAAGGGAAGWVNGLRGRAQNVRPSRSRRGGALRRSTVVVCAGHGREFSDPKRCAVAREVRPQSPKLKGQQNLKTAAAKIMFHRRLHLFVKPAGETGGRTRRML